MEKCYPNNKTFWFLSFLRRKSLLCIYVFIGFLLIFSIKKSKGEGTKQLQPLATDNGFIQIFDNNTLTRPFATYNCPVDNRLNIHVSALGEKVYLGFNQPNNDVYFRVKDPLGNIVMGPTLLPAVGPGFIANHTQAVAGPLPVAAGGYAPLSFLPALTGDYYIEFNPVSPTVVTPVKRVFSFIDITVVSATNAVLPGRLYSKSWDFQTNSGTNPFVANLYIYTPDGVVSGLDLNGIMPFGFVVSSNSTGCTKTGNFLNDRKSQAGNVNYPEFKIFLNDPDHAAYPTGSIGNITAPTTIMGCFPGPYCINVTTNANGSGQALLDLNGMAGYQAGTRDVLLVSNVVSGSNCIAWDGKDGLGNPVAVGTIVSVNVNYLFGLTNLPLYDAEFHPNGFKVFSVRPAAPTPLMMWDDGPISGTTNLAGCPGNTGCHAWPVSGAGFGNNNTVNTWWYINTAIDNTMLIIPDLTLTTSVVNALCNGAIPGSATVVPSGGKGPYSYLWNTNPVQTTATATNLSTGVYSVVVTDANGCGANKTSTISVVVAPNPIVNAGPDISVCPASGKVQLNGQVTLAAGGKWSGGSGSFSPNDTTLNAIYTLSPAEISSGGLSLTLTSVHNGPCAAISDQMLITVTAPLIAAINPQNPIICFGQTATTLTGSASGGLAPYNYLWNNVNPSSSINVGVGIYTLQVTDLSGCKANSSTTVTGFTSPTAAYAGADQIKCRQTPVTALKGSVTGASGGIWSGGTGVFIPSATALSTSYTPSSGELAQGFANLILTTTGSGDCPSGADTVKIMYVDFTGTVSDSITNVKCFGERSGSAKATITGGMPPYVYFWNSVPAQTGATASNLAVGTYDLSITNAIGCIYHTSATISQPAPLSIASNLNDVSCNGGNNGSIQLLPAGGTAPYSYLWLPGNETTSGISGKAGTYFVKVTDANGCTVNANNTLNEPSSLVLNFTQTDVNCFNGNNGTATVKVSGGTMPYSYHWQSGATAVTATGLKAGLQQVTVNDANGCIATGKVTIMQPSLLIANAAVTNVSCSYLSNGSALGSASGGTGPYIYSWNGGQKTAGISGQAAGAYQLTVNDNKGCTASTSAVISAPPPILIGFNGQIDVSCKSGNDGVVAATVSGGTPNYIYSWTPGGSVSNSLSGLSAGTYTVSVTDAKSCTASNTVVLSQPSSALSLTATITPVSCNGGGNGAILVQTSGGTAPYKYQWQGGQTTSGISAQTAGSYNVTVTDAKSCQITQSYSIPQPSPLQLNLSETDVSCYNGADGTAIATVTGGITPYTYTWKSGAVKASLSGLAAGLQQITVSDSNGCQVTGSLNIGQPMVLKASISVNNATCSYLNNGNALGTASGGTAPYVYSWKTGQSIAGISNLGPGNYALTINDSKGCTDVAAAVITAPSALGVNISGQNNVSCFGGLDGAIVANATGGTPNYNYSWAPGGLSSNAVNGLQAGNYTLTLTDAKGCTGTKTVAISQPSLALSVSATPAPATCNGKADGAVASVASGGTGPYTYTWLPGNATVQNLSNVLAGNYTVNAMDAKGCKANASATVTEPAALALTTSVVNSDCGQPNGQSSVSVAGGVGPFSYLWSPGGNTSATATGLLSGAYKVVVTDGNGCAASATGDVNENTAAVVTITSITNVNCHGDSTGSATLGTSGGTGPFTYSWFPYGGTGTTANGLKAGRYTVFVTGANGCKSLATTIPDITEPLALSVTVATTSVSCFGGNNATASANVSGGSPGYNYQWLPGNTAGTSVSNLAAASYSLKVTDAKNCVKTVPYSIVQPIAPVAVSMTMQPVSCSGGNDGAVNAIASGGQGPYNYSWTPGNFPGSSLSYLSIGNYTVSVTDARGCVASGSTMVTEPAPLTINVTSKKSNCSLPNGQAQAVVSGGTGAYNYQWSPTGGNAALANNLLSGNYTITAGDANGCMLTKAITVNNNPGPVATVGATTNVHCNGGSDGTAIVNVTSGTAPFSYAWSSGANTATASGLLPGIYTVSVKDANGCISNTASSPVITEASPIVISVATVPVNCYSGADGSATVAVSGGSPGYTYQWLPGGTTGTSLPHLSTGNYSIKVTDAINCTQNQSFTIAQPSSALSATLSFKSVSCFGGSDAVASVKVLGGTGAYTYNWLPGSSTGPSLSNLPKGIVKVFVKDANGCQTKGDSILVTQPAQPLSFSVKTNSVSCFSGSDGVGQVVASGGSPGYSFNWSPGGGTAAIAKGLTAGNYSVLLQDTNGCRTTAFLSIAQPTKLFGTLEVLNPSCGFSNGSVKTNISGGTGGYSYSWMPGLASGPGLSGLAPGNISVLVKDSLNCPLSLSTQLNNIPGPEVSIASQKDVACYGGNTGTATIGIVKGTLPYHIRWSPYGGDSLVATSLLAGQYVATIRDALGCKAVVTLSIGQPQPLNSTITSLNNVLCFGDNSGSASVSGSGGTPAYSYNWSGGQPIDSSAVKGLKAGLYSITLKDKNNCSITRSLQISQPTQLISVLDTSVNPVCYNGTGIAAVMAKGGTLPYKFAWSAPADKATSNSIHLKAGTYTATVTDANGCIASSKVQITQPTQVITTAGPNDTLCIGKSGVLTASAKGGHPPYYFGWQPTSEVTSGKLNITPLNNTSYTVVAYDSNGCPGTIDSVKAIVYDLLGAYLNISGATAICPGASSIIEAHVTGSTGPVTYSWNNKLGTGPGSFEVKPSKATTYTVKVTNACGVTLKDSIQVLINPQPNVALTFSTDAGCIPISVDFTDQSIRGNPSDSINSWVWNFGDNSGSVLQNPSHTYSSPGDFPVVLTVTTNGGCTSQNVLSPMMFHAYPIPIAAFTINSDILNLPLDYLQCTNLSKGAIQYDWTFGDGATSIQESPRYQYSTLGVYDVLLIAKNEYGCTDKAMAKITTTAEVTFPNAFTPNPSGPSGGAYDVASLNNDIFFPYTSGVIDYKLQIFNRWGELIFESFDVKTGWDGYYRGQLCQQDVYVYKAYVKLNNGKTVNKNGDVTLIK